MAERDLRARESEQIKADLIAVYVQDDVFALFEPQFVEPLPRP